MAYTPVQHGGVSGILSSEWMRDFVDWFLLVEYETERELQFGTYLIFWLGESN
jgi:hypothetical protein